MPEPLPRIKIQPRKIKPIKQGLKPNNEVRGITKSILPEIWGFNGKKDRFNEIYIEELKRRPITFLQSLDKKDPKIMVLGPAKGKDILVLIDELGKYGIKPSVDVLGLTNTISWSVRKSINKDYSQNAALETIGSNPNKFAQLIEQIKDKYNLIVAPMSVGYHTNYPAHNCFFTALMLAPEGEAYIDVAVIKKVKVTKYRDNEEVDISKHIQQKEIMPMIDYLNIVFPRLVTLYNKQHNTNYNFKLESIGCMVRIKRVR